MLFKTRRCIELATFISNVLIFVSDQKSFNYIASILLELLAFGNGTAIKWRPVMYSLILHAASFIYRSVSAKVLYYLHFVHSEIFLNKKSADFRRIIAIPKLYKIPFKTTLYLLHHK